MKTTHTGLALLVVAGLALSACGATKSDPATTTTATVTTTTATATTTTATATTTTATSSVAWWLGVQSRIDTIQAEYTTAEIYWRLWVAAGSRTGADAALSGALAQLYGAAQSISGSASGASPAELSALANLTVACFRLGAKSANPGTLTMAQFDAVSQTLMEIRGTAGAG
ncbi:MAG: hypothetical protein HIU84_01875 [Acidobacteria bacterium]|nr:hypothetical protein [Acidobacteriota bacterium]